MGASRDSGSVRLIDGEVGDVKDGAKVMDEGANVREDGE